MNTMNRRKDNAGMALVTALIFISVALVVLTAMTARHVQQRVAVDRFEDYYTCFEVAESAMGMGRAALERVEVDFRVGIPTGWEPTWDETTNMLIMPDFGETGITPGTFDAIPGSEYILYIHEWDSDLRDTNGDGAVDSIQEAGFYSVHVEARFNGYRRRLEAVYSSQNINVWRNAIFAGSGQAGGLISGNVSVAGSVHLLGENLPVGGLAVSALDMSGTSLIHNNYDGMPANMLARTPPLPLTTLEDGRVVPTVQAELRVKNGLVALSGNSMVGEPADNTMVKRLMDGVYVNQGFAGGSTVAGVPTMVFSDNGWEEKYDLGNKITFPVLSEPWRNPDGTMVHSPHTGTWYTHEEYFTEVLVGDPDIRTDGIHEGNITLNLWDKNGTEGYYWNATTGQKVVGTAAVAAIVPDPTHSFIQFIPGAAETSVLRINGNIRINGSLTLTGKGNQTVMNYTGRAALLVRDNVSIETNIYTTTTGPLAFPINNCLGIMAKGTMNVGLTAQLSIMGAFYSETQINTEKQTNVLGTFVSQYFNMGTNVPSIFQIPILVNNLPFGMIGNYPIINMRSESWRELDV